MPSMFKDLDYYKRVVKESRENLLKFGINTYAGTSEMVIGEKTEYSSLLPYYDIVKSEFAGILEKLNEEIRHHNKMYKEYKLIDDNNSRIKNAIQRGFVERLNRTYDNAQVPEVYEKEVIEKFNNNLNKIKKCEDFTKNIEFEIYKTCNLKDELEKKTIYKRFHKSEYEKQKKELSKKIDELKKMRDNNDSDLSRYKILQEGCAAEKNIVSELNKPLNGYTDYVDRYLSVNEKLNLSWYYAKKADELEQQIKKLDAKEKYFISTVLAKKYREYEDLTTEKKGRYEDKYNLLDWNYMIYTLADSAAKEGLIEAQGYIESMLSQISVEKDENRMMDVSLCCRIKENLLMLHAMAFCENESAVALLSDIESFRNTKVFNISEKIRHMSTNVADTFEDKKEKLVKEILEAAERKKHEIEFREREEDLSSPLPTVYEEPEYDVEIVYVPDVSDM